MVARLEGIGNGSFHAGRGRVVLNSALGAWHRSLALAVRCQCLVLSTHFSGFLTVWWQRFRVAQSSS